jgi:nucleoside phosphorylase
MKPPIAITFALPVESSTFRRRIRGRTRRSRNTGSVVRGRVQEQDVEILHTGVGEEMSSRRIREFLRNRHFRYLISSGFAGAVFEGLQAGDLILAENFSDPGLLSAAQQILRTGGVRAVKLFTSRTMVESADARRAIARRDGAAAVDMETRSIANACSARGIPVLSLRCISDTARGPIPAPANVLFDIQRQRTPFFRLAGYAVKNPAVILRLVRFQRQVAQARDKLADAIITLISKF